MHRRISGAAGLAIGVLAAACLEVPSEADLVGIVELATDSISLTLGDTTSVSATVSDDAGMPLPTRKVTWSSNNPGVVQISTNGFVTAIGVGTTSITAESGGRSASATVTVTATFITLSAGLNHTCAVTDDSRVACWGSNSSGKLGDGTLFSASFPALVSGDRQFEAVHAGGTHTCGLATDGSAHCWGANWSAQLGIGSVDGAANTSPSSVAGGLVFTSLSVGDRHACAATELGTAYCWGGGRFGQLGIGPQSENCPLFPEPCNMSPTPVSGSTSFLQVSAAQEHSCGLAFDGRAHCWGGNITGSLGDSSFVQRETPGPVAGDLEFTTLSAGSLHTCALTVDGSAYCWGFNTKGQLGDGTELNKNFPVPVGGGLTFTSVSSGGVHTCGITTDGAAYCWGANEVGQLGTGSRTSVATPLPVAGDITFALLSAGQAHTCGISVAGRAYCWGFNASGQLGIGSDEVSLAVPTLVVGQP